MGWKWVSNQIFGGNTLVGRLLNPAGAMYDKNTEESRASAEAATEAAKAQQRAAEAELKAQQDALTLQAEKAALDSQAGTDTRTATVVAGGGAEQVLPTQRRRRGASTNITVGL